jgi:hypothetical protein
MARKILPARPARDRSREDESLLLRSAESLGRMIGSLQRQLEIATGRLTGTNANPARTTKTNGARPRKRVPAQSGTVKTKRATAARSGGRKSAATKVTKKR